MSKLVINHLTYGHGTAVYNPQRGLPRGLPIKLNHKPKPNNSKPSSYWGIGPQLTIDSKDYYYEIGEEHLPQMPPKLLFSGDLSKINNFGILESVRFSRSRLLKLVGKPRRTKLENADIIIYDKIKNIKNATIYNDLPFDGNEYYNMSKSSLKTHYGVNPQKAVSLTLFKKCLFSKFEGKFVSLPSLIDQFGGIKSDLSNDEICELYKQVLSKNKSVSSLGLDTLCAHSAKYNNVKKLVISGAILNKIPIRSSKSEVTKLLIQSYYKEIRSIVKYNSDNSTRIKAYIKLCSEVENDSIAKRFISSSLFIDSFFGLSDSEYSISIYRKI